AAPPATAPSGRRTTSRTATRDLSTAGAKRARRGSGGAAAGLPSVDARAAPPADEPPSAAGPRRDRLAGDDRRRGRRRPDDQGRGSEPVPHPVGLDGADASL